MITSTELRFHMLGECELFVFWEHLCLIQIPSMKSHVTHREGEKTVSSASREILAIM
jgi:hypothetical protein